MGWLTPKKPVRNITENSQRTWRINGKSENNRSRVGVKIYWGEERKSHFSVWREEKEQTCLIKPTEINIIFNIHICECVRYEVTCVCCSLWWEHLISNLRGQSQPTSAPLSPLDGNIVLFKHNSLSTKYENHRNPYYPTPPKDNKFYKKRGVGMNSCRLCWSPENSTVTTRLFPVKKWSRNLV